MNRIATQKRGWHGRLVPMHGRSRTAEYRAWEAMIQRCTNPRCRIYAYYGGRGITVSATWRRSFEAFYAHMGPRPRGHSLERIDNERGYEPGNCKWATKPEQQNNTRWAKRVTVMDVSLSVTEAARALGVKRQAIYDRVRRHNVTYQAAVDHFLALRHPALGSPC